MDVANKNDLVAHPPHYRTGRIEVWDFIVDQNLGYLAGCALKYVCRYRYKGKPLEDLRKARAYIDRLIAEETKCAK